MNLVELLQRTTDRFPDHLAVCGPDGPLTYRQLDELAERIAGALTVAGVRQGDRVVVWADKSSRTVAALQAVLRLDAAYVPVDATTPTERAATIITDCTASAVLADPEQITAARAARLAGAALIDLSDLPALPARTVTVPRRTPDPDDLAYILYTSGSTGHPKGVCLSHRNARAYVDWAVDELALTPTDRLSNHASLTFDLSVLDLYGAFAAGASVHLVPAALSSAPTDLVRFLRDTQISVWYSVPSALVLMMRDGALLDNPPPPALRTIVFAGEPFPLPFVRQLAAWTAADLYNFYGPTETNVCTFHKVGPADLQRDRPVPIGRACSGDTLKVQTASGPSDTAGTEGELLVHGPTVMLGYWGQPPPPRTYPTGDLVRVLPDGALDYLGRRDQMVKVRGYRVELGEVESVLAAHPQVADVAVTVVGTGADSRLHVFMVPRTGTPPGLLSLKRHAARRLPLYMLPDRVSTVTAIPRTANGKTDRRALAEASTPPTPGTTHLAPPSAAPPARRSLPSQARIPTGDLVRSSPP